MLCEAAEKEGERLDREAVRREAVRRDAVRRDAMADRPDLELGSRKLEEEIAGLRVVMRKTIQLASEAKAVDEAVRLADIYGHECLRLLRLVTYERSVQDRMEVYIEEQAALAIRELNEEWGW